MQVRNNLQLTLIKRTGNYASNCKMFDSDINLVLQLSSFEEEIWSSNFINEWAVTTTMTDEKIIIKTWIVFQIHRNAINQMKAKFWEASQGIPKSLSKKPTVCNFWINIYIHVIFKVRLGLLFVSLIWQCHAIFPHFRICWTTLHHFRICWNMSSHQGELKDKDEASLPNTK